MPPEIQGLFCIVRLEHLGTSSLQVLSSAEEKISKNVPKLSIVQLFSSWQLFLKKFQYWNCNNNNTEHIFVHLKNLEYWEVMRYLFTDCSREKYIFNIICYKVINA